MGLAQRVRSFGDPLVQTDQVESIEEGARGRSTSAAAPTITSIQVTRLIALL
jgi:hypothetical protein